MILVFIFILFYSLSRYYDLSDYGLSSGFRYWQLIAYNFIHLTFMHMFFNSIPNYSNTNICNPVFCNLLL